jgi:hypothetical protein
LRAALAYLEAHRRHPWAREIGPWARAMRQALE